MSVVAAWCRAGSSGFCAWDIALDGIREQCDVDDLEDDWPLIEEAIEVNGDPVIATIGHPRIELAQDHAIVIVGLGNDENDAPSVFYMDPMTGDIESKSADEFKLWWNAPGGRAFTIGI